MDETQRILALLAERSNSDLQRLRVHSEACTLGMISDSKQRHAQCGTTECKCYCHDAHKQFPQSWQR